MFYGKTSKLHERCWKREVVVSGLSIFENLPNILEFVRPK